MQEFAFLYDNSEEIVLDDSIKTLNLPNDEEFLVSNSKSLNAQIYAPEINFYLNNTKENMLLKAKNSLKLYEARATAFDFALDADLSKSVSKNILLISDELELSVKKLENAGFKVICLNHNEVKFLYGEIGELVAIVLQKDGEFEIEFDILLVRNAKDYMLKQSGCFEIDGLEDYEILNLANKVIPVFNYKKIIAYDAQTCQYKSRRTKHCAKCVDACPTVAIMKDDEIKELEFSDIDCIACGACISVCPSGSLEYNSMPRNGFYEVAKIYADKIVLAFEECLDISNLSINLKENILPFPLKSVNFLDQSYLLTLLQTTGATVVLYAKQITSGTKESLELVNEIYEKIYGTKGIEVANDEESLKIALDRASFISNSKYDLNETNLSKREIFSKRVLYMLNGKNHGKTGCGELVRYGRIIVNESSCTLCLSCVGACNVGALYADKSDNSLKFNASICTTCGYCETSCAEKDTLTVIRDGMSLEPSYFEYKTLAKDELFKCAECGKEFATVKSVKKIASMLEPVFNGNDLKIRTLYCCADCKAKLMMMSDLEKEDL